MSKRDEQYVTSRMDELEKEDVFFILSEIRKCPQLTQRELSLRLNMSLGKINHLIKKLVGEGMIRVRTSSCAAKKIKKIKYTLTSKGLKKEMNLAYRFLKRKEAEYKSIKREWETLVVNNNHSVLVKTVNGKT